MTLAFVAAVALTLRTAGLRTLLACAVGAAFGLGVSFVTGGVYSRKVDPMGVTSPSRRSTSCCCSRSRISRLRGLPLDS